MRTLEVENLAVLAGVSIAFGAGLNVLSGETGAGKSLLLDAMQLALGARGGADLVRPGCQAARVAALFDVAPGSAVERELQALGVEPGDGSVLLAREVGADGRGTCRVNGRLCTQANLRQVGAHLVTLVGQGAQHRFATPSGQLAFLDAYGGAELLLERARVERAHAIWAEETRAAAAQGGAEERRALRESLAEQVAEIERIAPRPEEEEDLPRRREVLAHAERLVEGAERALHLLREGDDAVGDRLAGVRRELQALARLDSALDEPAGLVEQAWIAVDEACHALGRYRQRTRFDPDELRALEERWGALQRLKRRYGESLADIVQRAVDMRARLRALEETEERAARAAERVEQAGSALGQAAAVLCQMRAQTAERLEGEVGEELASLGMVAARFGVTLARQDDPGGVVVGDRRVACGPTGADRVEFTWAANPGLPEAPLGRAASGGELSRLLLALHALRASEVDVATVVFDEIDAGVGGLAARAVAERLQSLGSERQVLCVTHQAVIAAAADHHFAIQKEESVGMVSTVVRPLPAAERAAEVARMLDGGRGRASHAHATDMLRGLARATERPKSAAR